MTPPKPFRSWDEIITIIAALIFLVAVVMAAGCITPAPECPDCVCPSCPECEIEEIASMHCESVGDEAAHCTVIGTSGTKCEGWTWINDAGDVVMDITCDDGTSYHQINPYQ